MLKKSAVFVALFFSMSTLSFASSVTDSEKMFNDISGTTFIYCIVSLLLLGLIAIIGMYYKKINISEKNAKNILWLILIVGLVIRMIIAYNTKGFANDIASFVSWANSAVHDFYHFYSSGSSGTAGYTPAYIYVLAIVGFIMKILGSENTNNMSQLLIKMPSIIVDLGIAYFLFRSFKDKLIPQVRIALALLIVFNPLLITNSSFWGQVDSILVLLLALVAVFMVRDKIYWATFFMAIAILFKPQAIFFFPMLVFELLRRRNIKQILISAGVGIGSFFGFCLPFAWVAKSDAFPLGGTPLWIFNLYMNAADQLTYASVNSLNFFGMLGKNWVSEKEIFLFDMDFATWGNVLMALGYIITGFLFFFGVWKKFLPKDDLTQERKNFKIASAIYLAPILMNIGFYIFGARMHERYMIPAAILLIFAFAYIKDLRILIAFIGFSITNFANLLYLMLLPSKAPWMNQNNLFVIGFSTLNVLLALFVFYTAYDILILNRVMGAKLILQENMTVKKQKYK